MITVNVKRYDPEKNEHYVESYEIEKTEKMKVLDAIQQINDKYEANIAYRYSCRAGQCGSCAIKINDKAKLACKAEINDNDTLAPLDSERLIKDLVVDRVPLNKKVREFNLYMASEDSYSDMEEPAIMKPETYEKTKTLRDCVDCYSCISMCPVLKVNEDYIGPYFMRFLSDLTFDPREDSPRSDEAVDLGIYKCTSCGQCSKTCPKEIDIYGKAIEKLRAQICREKEGPLKAHKQIRESVITTGRSVTPKSEKYPEGFVKEYNKDKKSDKKEKIAFFTGCMIDNRLPWIAEYTVKILNKLGYEVDIPEEQVCCGSPLIRTGQIDIIPGIINKNYEIFKDYDTVITVCAGCGSTIKRNYPEYGAKLNVKDITEFLEDKINPDDLKELNLKVTYHDPCHLVRGQNISEQPRNIIKKLKGVEFIEMDKPDQCCGAGGGVKSGEPEIAESLADEKVKMIEELDVDHVVTVCPFCERNIQDSINKNNSKKSVINIMELLNEAYGFEE